MGPLEAAKALAAVDPLAPTETDMLCPYCETTYELVTRDNGGKSPKFSHGSECPWLAMPQIVAALEAATEVVGDGHPPLTEQDDCVACGGPAHPDLGWKHLHDFDCPWVKLVSLVAVVPTDHQLTGTTQQP